jgi:N-carbamoyl-L-amino-acid hydrolase
MREVGLKAVADCIGDPFGIWQVGAEGAGPLMPDSHTDTVINAGIYDGCYGVLGGLEMVQTLREAGLKPKLPVIVVALINEKGVRFAPNITRGPSSTPVTRTPAAKPEFYNQIKS